MVKLQGAEDEGAGSVLKYMTKPKSDSYAADWPLWHADLLTVQPSRLDSLACCKPRHTKMQTSAHSGSEKTLVPSHFWLPKT